MKGDNLAPIVLFVYARLWHTQQTIESLQENELAEQSELIIYSDAAKNSEATESVKKVRNYIKNISGFKKITIIERTENFGLANSIIDGVTTVVNKHGKIIVLEDDLVTSPLFLKFMNDALIFYKKKPQVWHISGWNYPIDTKDLDDVFFWKVMNCWGWATWDDRWKSFNKNPSHLINTWTKQDINEFNLDGYENFWVQVLENKSKKINTWAIFWYSSIFLNKGVCLNPSTSYINNIGCDNSGENSISKNKIEINNLNLKPSISFPEDIVMSNLAIKKIMKFYNNRRSLLEKLRIFVNTTNFRFK